jgi:ankyrin repeat protein
MSEQQPPAGGTPSGDSHAVDQLRQQAKQLLKQARAADAVVIGKLRELLPRLVSQSDADVAASIQLADVQHAVARKLGHDSWATLKAFYETLDPVHAEAARFLKALREDDTAGALRVLDRSPAVARYSIHTASALADVDTVQAMLAASPSLANTPSPGDAVVPLIYAVYEDIKRARGVSAEAHCAVVRALLDAGADPNSSVALPDVSDRISALFFPCNAGNVPVARLLLERGANPTDGEALYHGAQQGHIACLELLVEFGADLHRGPDVYGNTPLHFLAAHTPDNRITPQAMRGLHWLLAHGADPRIPSTGTYVTEPQRGETPLHRAAAVGHDVAGLRALVEHGAPLDAARDDGLTAYRLAVRGGHEAQATYLAQAGASEVLEPVDELMAACASGRAVDAQRVVEAHPGILATLGPSERDALGLAVTRNDLETVRLMARLGWPLTQEGEWGGTPLHWAAWHGRTDMVRVLLDAGAPVNVRDNRYGSSPIAWCAHGSRFCDRANDEDYPAIVHLLIDAGATRPESYNQWNESPESMARPSVVAALKARGFAV